MKESWHCSSCFDALGQILVMNKQLDKLSAFHIHHAYSGLLSGPVIFAGTVVARMAGEEERTAVDGEHSTYVVWLTQHFCLY
ncbi:hypothetical protein ID866_8725 [Astraeus odoratus]|nr:hypothetical protein ID866_8725 [Astraeus odoratus]